MYFMNITNSPHTRLEALISHLLHMRDKFDKTRARRPGHIEIKQYKVETSV